MRVLLSAYSARAGHGSEPGTGWGWARHLAEAGHDVTLLTHARNEADNRAWLGRHPLPNLAMECVPSSRPVRALRAAVPSDRAGRVIEYVAWRRPALRRARRLHRDAAFDVVHHATYGSIVPGSPMWRLGVPFVFGPLGSGQRVPSGARALFGHAWYWERLRNGIIAATGRRLNPLAATAVRHAATVVATNDATLQVARGLGARHVELMCDTGIAAELLAGPRRRPRGQPRHRVVWVSRLTPRKGLRLAVDAIAQAAREIDVELHIVGDGPQRADLARWVTELGISDRTRHHGRLPWRKVMDLYASCDALLFTSVQETFGSQLVEAAAFGLPIVAVDLHGAASVLPADAALKAPFRDIPSVAAALSRALVHLLTDEATYAGLSQGAINFARSQTWPERVRRMERLYADSIDRASVAV
jgi:glycosyltransferase involved in cell wall biosynthesis